MLNSNQINDELNFSKYFRYIAFNVYRIIFIGIICFLIWLAYFIFSPRIYEIQSLIQVDGKSSNIGSYEQIIGGGGERISLDEQIYLYKSRTNQEEIIKRLDLNIFVDGFVDPLSSKKIDFSNVTLLNDVNSYQFILNVSDSDEISITSDGTTRKLKGILGKKIEFENIAFQIDSFKEDILNKDITISVVDYDSAIKMFLDVLTLEKYIGNVNFFNQPTLLGIGLRTANVELGMDIVNESNNIYIEKGVERNVLEAQKSLNFIKAQNLKVKNDLKRAERELNDFKKSITSVDIELEVEGIVEEVIFLDKELKKLELREAEIKSIYTSSNPILIQLQNQKIELKNQQDRLNAEIESLPETRQEYLNLFRNVQINQVLFEDLLARELEFSIIEASTLGNAFVVDEAFRGPRVSPRGLASLMFTIVMAIVLGILYALIRGRFFSRIQIPSDIVEELPDLKLLGVLSNMNNDDREYSDSIDALATNLSLISEETNSEGCKVIQIIGATKSVGKSTTSVNLAKTLSKRNKKVILIDMDHRRGQLHKFFDINKPETNIFSQENMDLNKFKINEYLSLIPRPSKSSSKVFSSIDSPIFRDLINKIKSEFDFIIFDTAPVLAVSDSIALSKYSDHLLLVARHNQSKIDDLYRTLIEFNTVGKSVQYVIYNSFEKPDGFYYYDYYSYKYYSNYDYGYSEDE
tara:strand:+ start:8119 stop:10194 length:2076 start_codon:yes stop_codon:yes gene_type:complete